MARHQTTSKVLFFYITIRKIPIKTDSVIQTIAQLINHLDLQGSEPWKDSLFATKKIATALNTDCDIKSGQFWTVVIPRQADFVIKLAKKPSVEFKKQTQSEYTLLKKYLAKYLVNQESYWIDENMLLLQERVDYPFQINSAIFERTFSKDRLFLSIFAQVYPQFKTNMLDFIKKCALMHKQTGHIIDLWGSGNLIFDFPTRHSTPIFIDTTFLFTNVPQTTKLTRDQRYMQKGYNKSSMCLDKLSKLLGR